MHSYQPAYPDYGEYYREAAAEKRSLPPPGPGNRSPMGQILVGTCSWTDRALMAGG